MAASILSSSKKPDSHLGYRLGRIIGRGGCGEVWEAISPAGLPVALKFLRCDNDHTATRELRALQSVRQLKHPHLINTYQIWAETGQIAVAMELAEGSLLDVLEVSLESTGHALEPSHACYYLQQAAYALDFLNARQHLLGGRRVAVRHCDVKPSNLLLFSTTVKVADFSFSVQASAPLGSFERAGTLDFAGPEVFQGWLSDRSDQFALAVTFCQLRTGEYPYPETPSSFERDYIRPAPDLSKLNSKEIPILLRALHPIPQNRWPSCTDLMNRLQATVD